MKCYTIKAVDVEEEFADHFCPAEKLREILKGYQQEEQHQEYRHSRKEAGKLMEILARTPTAKNGIEELCIGIPPIF